MEVASGPVHIRALGAVVSACNERLEGAGYYSMQASRWTEIAPRPEVAAAQMEVPSAPTKLENIPPSFDWVVPEELAIADARVP